MNMNCYDPDDGLYEKVRYSKIGKHEDMDYI